MSLARALISAVFIRHLKQTRMPLKEIERYLRLASGQDYASCYGILAEHKLDIERQMAEMQASLEAVTYKMGHFLEMMKRSGLGGN